ncbi:hypothetical protein DMI80_03525 [Akkermansia muciniphila]|nr:hypothetical protein CXT92_01475 [Akkermansia muciniphila]PNC88096.1 hypothetical protein CXT97_02200 [Akkermansia muciniphila]PNC91542.1 hypothetical protein CXT91_06715 [Akkermansia muciniphila]PND00317.1 hypothetical protein CXT90_05270 [Akkermansia muciniphila]PND14043.1 hypothetical protein CXT96_06645 [Akkermansia muciniphila]
MRYGKRCAGPVEKKGSPPLPLSSKFWITLIPEKHIQPEKKLSPPFNGICRGKGALMEFSSFPFPSGRPSIRVPGVSPGRQAHTEWAVASIRK